MAQRFHLAPAWTSVEHTSNAADVTKLCSLSACSELPKRRSWAETVSSGRSRLRLTPGFVAVAGEVTFVEILPVGTKVRRGGAIGLATFADLNECELRSPVAGMIAEQNDAARLEPPALLNSDPQGAGWLIELEPA